MNTILMNSKNSKTSDPLDYYSILEIKSKLKKNDKNVALSNLSMY